MSSPTTRFIPLLPFATSKEVRDGSGPCYSIRAGSSESENPDIAQAGVAEAVVAISDEALVARLCIGDTDALAYLFRRYALLVRSVAWKILRDRFEADDLLQEIFILIHRKASTFDSVKASARFWILQMTYHRAISRLRYLKCRHFYAQVDLEEVEAQLPDPSNQIEQVEQYLDSAVKNSALQKIMATLSDNQQKTLRLYFFEGYTLDEIAVELGQTRDNVRNHYFRGLAKLRTQISSNKIEDELREQIFRKNNARRPI